MKRLFLYIMAFAAFSCTAFAAEGDDGFLKINAAVKPEKTSVGVPVEYRVSIAGRDLKDLQILLPESREIYPEKNAAETEKAKEAKPEKENAAIDDDAAKAVPLCIINSAKKEDHSEKDISYLTVVMSLTYYRTGTYSLPEIDILDAQKTRVGYKVPSITISEFNKEGKFQEIEPPMELGGNWHRLMLLILGVIVLTVAAVFLTRYIMKRRAEKKVPVPESPLESFLKEVDKMRGPEMIRENKIEEYTVAISAAFRRFLSGYYGFDATEMTTEEIRRKLMQVLRVHGRQARLEEIIGRFNLWDLAKFAEFMPSQETLLRIHEETVGTARSLAEEVQDGPAGV